MLDLREVTADDAITAMMTVEGLRVPAGELRPGDKVVYHLRDSYHVDVIYSVVPEYGNDHWVCVATVSGDSWKCSPKNTLCLRVST